MTLEGVHLFLVVGAGRYERGPLSQPNWRTQAVE